MYHRGFHTCHGHAFAPGRYRTIDQLTVWPAAGRRLNTGYRKPLSVPRRRLSAWLYFP